MESFIENWQQRSSSEKVTLAGVAALVVLGLFYLFVFDPIVSWQQQEKKRLVVNERVLGEVTALAKRFDTQANVGTENDTGLASMIDSSLQKNNLTMRGFQPGKKNDARLRLSNVAYDSLTQWLYDLEYQHNIAIEELSVTQAKTPGLLMVSVRVRK